MTVREAKEVAQQWAQENVAEIPGLYGALLHGSILDLPEDATLSQTSDVDVLVVLDDPEQLGQHGKFLYRNVLLEVSPLGHDQVFSAEQVLSNYQLAGSFRRPGILADPSGQLLELQQRVAEEYAWRFWVTRRCDHAQNNVLRFLQSLKETAPFHEQVPTWLFATGVLTHILLVAGLKNPTVRKRYVAAKDLLAEYERSDFYETLLEPLGCAQMTRDQVARHLETMSEAFDAAQSVLKTPYRFAADLSGSGRAVAIEGSRELIQRGEHREAVFWIVATYSRCLWVLAHDAPPEIQARHEQGYRRLLGDLGIFGFADLARRGEEVRALLPRVREMAEQIRDTNPQIIS